ncbi:cohesin domain-containing protein [Gemmatimonadota bacterium]
MRPSTPTVASHSHSLLLLIVALAVLAGCEAILPTVPDLEPDNPLDPDSPSFVIPETTLLSGPSEGETVNTSGVTFSWEGNAGATVFQTRFTGEDWTTWSPTKTRSLEYLEEGLYQFEVRSGYPNAGGGATYYDLTPASVNFTVDAVPASSVRLSPLLVETGISSTFDVLVVAEDVEDLMGARLELRFGPAALQCTAVEIGGFLSSNSGTVLSQTFTDNALGSIGINLAVAGASPSGVSGSGILAIVRFQALSVVDTSISLHPGGTTLRDSDNLSIVISQLVGSEVRIR